MTINDIYKGDKNENMIERLCVHVCVCVTCNKRWIALTLFGKVVHQLRSTRLLFVCESSKCCVCSAYTLLFICESSKCACKFMNLVTVCVSSVCARVANVVCVMRIFGDGMRIK
jgi:hypothetical protein